MVNLNGKLLQLENANLTLDNRGLNYGDAVFETLKLYDGKIFFWKDHYLRLTASMRILRMEIPIGFTMEFLEDEILKTVASSENKETAFRVKLLVWRKTGGKYTPTTNEIEYAISSEKLDTPFYVLNGTDYEVGLFEDHYITSGLLSTLKTNNRLINVLGSIFAKENGYQNCLLLDQNKQVVEALNGNIFVVYGNKIKTPPLVDGCLNGIMRKQVISILKEFSEFECEEASISVSEFQKADEGFITNVIQGVMPITKYGNKKFGNKVATLLLPKLNLKTRVV